MQGKVFTKLSIRQANYFLEIASLVDKGGGGRESSAEETEAICAQALEESTGKELQLACDPSCGRGLQTLLLSCDVSHNVQFLSRCGAVAFDMSVDPSASHILESALKSLARALLNENVQGEEYSEGITFVQFKMKPCGENLPHTHPRAIEIVTLVSGGPLQVGVVSTEPEAHFYILHPGDVMVFPRGLLHFKLNVSGEEAFYISALNSQNPGVLTAQQAYFQLPLRAAAGGLNQSFKTTETLQEDHPTTVVLQLVSKKMGCVPNKDITTKI
ncbi:unnamed protein product [Calypogeia fissa]